MKCPKTYLQQGSEGIKLLVGHFLRLYFCLFEVCIKNYSTPAQVNTRNVKRAYLFLEDSEFHPAPKMPVLAIWGKCHLLTFLFAHNVAHEVSCDKGPPCHFNHATSKSMKPGSKGQWPI